MNHIENVGETILLDGQPLSLATHAGVAAWVENGIEHNLSKHRPSKRWTSCCGAFNTSLGNVAIAQFGPCFTSSN